MKKLTTILLLCICSLTCFAQITYFGSASIPVDDPAAANAVATITVTPPASMVSGDLVCFWGQTKTNTGTFSVTTTGGQTWNSVTPVLTATTLQAAQLFWCRFNGTWAANPTITVIGGSPYTGVMHVFRPTTSSNTWAVNIDMTELDFSAPATPSTVTITGQTTTQASTITLASWFSADDNAWGSIAGAGWLSTGTDQYRNLSGSDQSSSFAHKIQTVAGATGNVSKNQTALGGDLGTTGIITFYEVGGSSAAPRRLILIQ
ncbi:MAG: hypothetical protein WKF91_21120 [Segetibacter sp.]